jgi:hypothetical protein
VLGGEVEFSRRYFPTRQSFGTLPTLYSQTAVLRMVQTAYLCMIHLPGLLPRSYGGKGSRL